MFRNTLDKMLQIRDEKKAEDGGFTLIELLVVVVIIGILIAIAIPLYLNYQHGAKDKSSQSDLRGAVSAINQCYTDNGNNYPTAVTFTGAGGTGTPTGTGTPNPCANDTINLSDGTTMVYATKTGGFTLTASNDGGNRGASNPFTYDSTLGGKIS